jgi:hypothetical protein
MTEQEKQLKKQFEKVRKLTKERHQQGIVLDKMIKAKWGFHYSDTDDDPMIDTLDYGTNSISFENFKERMEEYKKNYDENNGEFGVIP